MLTLILLNPDPNRKTRTFHLDGQRPEVIGRHSEKIKLPDSRISRRHAEISVQNGVWVIRDLGSSNGTWVNGQRITTLCELEEGDRLQIGRLTLIVGHVEVDLAMHDQAVATEQDTDAGVEAVASAETLVQADEQPADDDQDVIALQAAADDELATPSSPLLAEASQDTPEQAAAEPVHEVPLAAADLDTGDAVDAHAASDDSSIAPSDELEPAAPLSEAEIEKLDGAGFDEIDDDEDPDLAELIAGDDEDEDIYAESAGVITPVVSRPESPIDPTVRGASEDRDELLPETAAVVDEAADGAGVASGDADVEHTDDDVAAEDEAPPVVGLSLDMPAPDAPNPIGEDAASTDESAADAEAVGDPDGDDGDELPLAALSIDDDLDAALDDGMTAEFLESLDAEDDQLVEAAAVAPEPPAAQASSEAPPKTGAAFTHDSSAPAEPAEATAEDSELVEPEAMQEIADSSGPRRGWWKVAALLLIAAGVGGGWWVVQKTAGPDPITGRSVADRPADATPPNPTTDAVVATENGGADLQGTPPSVEDKPDVDPQTLTAEASPALPTVDPFGDAPTLGARPAPEPTLTPPPIDSPPVAQSQTADASAPSVTPTASAHENTYTQVSGGADVLPDTEAGADNTTGAALARLDPRPQDAWEPVGTVTDASVDVTEIALTGALDPEAPAQTAEAPDAASTADTPARHIVYLVDASGSMVDSMNQGVLTWLENAIEDLDERDRFTVVFFRSGEVFEVPPVGLKPAENQVRQDALAWMSPQAGNIRPRGKSDPVDALRLARQYEATELYILSDDKFGDRGNSVAAIDVRDVAGFWVGQDVVFNTVQFYYEKEDDRRLQAIARRFGGEYEFVEEPPFDRTPGVDLFGVSQ
ncbi:MAG: FHA domain-containing protein [Planctomycetota bacterium]